MRDWARLRLVWDGKDRWLWIMVTTSGKQPAPSQWVDLEDLLGAPPKAHMLTDGDLAQVRVDGLGAVLRHYLERE